MIKYIDVLTYISPALLLLGIVCGMYYFLHLKKGDRVIILYLFLSLVVDFCGRFLGRFLENNLIMWTVLAMVELIVFAFVFYVLNQERNFWKERVVTLIGLAYMISELIWLDPSKVTSFQTYSKPLAAFLIVVIAMWYMYHHFQYEKVITYRRLRLVLAIFIYFSLNTILLLPMNFLVSKTSPLVFYVWLSYLILTLTFYSFLIFHLWNNGRSRRPLHSG